MRPERLFEILAVAERLKCNTRHSWTSTGRRESVAEHSWRLALMALLVADEFPDVDCGRVVRMCLVHDLGEAFTGDIPAFEKRRQDETHEAALLARWVETLPEPLRAEWRSLYAEMEALATPEARLYKALDKLEAVIQHNEADIATWLPLEYDLNIAYGADEVAWNGYLRRLKEARQRNQPAENRRGASSGARRRGEIAGAVRRSAQRCVPQFAEFQQKLYVLAGLRPARMCFGTIPNLFFGVSCKQRVYHLLAPKGGAKSIRQAKMSGNRRRPCLKCCADKLAPAFSTAQPLSVLLPAFSQGGAMVRCA